jgi:hypothetical protein
MSAEAYRYLLLFGREKFRLLLNQWVAILTSGNASAMPLYIVGFGTRQTAKKPRKISLLAH